MKDYYTDNHFLFLPQAMVGVLKQQSDTQEKGFFHYISDIEKLENLVDRDLIAEMLHTTIEGQWFIMPHNESLVDNSHKQVVIDMFNDLWGADKVDEIMAAYNPTAKENYKTLPDAIADGSVEEPKWDGVVQHEVVETLEYLHNFIVIEYGTYDMDTPTAIGHTPKRNELMKRIIYACGNDHRLEETKRQAYWYLINRV